MTVVKICGLTQLDDALAAVEAGADWLGFVLVATSPRYVAPERAREIVAGLHRRGVKAPCVGVVVGQPLTHIQALKEECGFDLIQLHGAESRDVVAALLPGVIVACQVTGAESLAALAGYPAYAYLLDARGADRRVAEPATWDWSLLRTAGLHGRIIVAGGLRPANVAQALRVARPFGVDVASGVECAPGRKDHLAMASFVRIVREVDNEGEHGL